MKPFLYELPILPDAFQFPADYLSVVMADEGLDIVKRCQTTFSNAGNVV